MFFIKKALIISSLFFFSTAAFSQDYVDKIVTQTCDCFSKVPDTLSTDVLQMKLGFCMIAASEPYKKEIKKDYNINLDNLDKATGERLGRLLGVKFAGECPEAILKMQGKKNSVVKQATVLTFTGIVTKIEINGFVTFSIKDETGKTTTFYWLEFIECENDLPSIYNSLTGKLVSVSYKSNEYFEPRLNQYKQYFCITKLEIIDK
ncbi:MAG TPA: hypothetical protein VK796_10940 [Cytophaga sp.]|jgi:hypothetical protein|nr:hypothetical protein [Cytophaga sp.]